MKNSNVLSVNQSWTDAAKKADNNQMKVKGQTIVFRTTFKVETMEVLQKLLEMKKGHYIAFKKDEARIVNNALLKIGREQSCNKLTSFNFIILKGLKKKKLIVGRQ
jgi:hypothetical protein